MDIIDRVKTVIEDRNLTETMKKVILLEMAKTLVVTYVDFLSDVMDISVEEALANIYNQTDSLYDEHGFSRVVS